MAPSNPSTHKAQIKVVKTAGCHGLGIRVTQQQHTRRPTRITGPRGTRITTQGEITGGNEKRGVGVLSSARARETTMTKVASCPVHGPASTDYILLLAWEGAQAAVSPLKN